MRDAWVEVAISPGMGEPPLVVRFPLSYPIAREVFEPLERSDEPFALMLHSLPMGRDYVSYRRKKIEYRGTVVEEVTRAIQHALHRAFAQRDTKDGYSSDER